jgi:hypothetical protein
VTYDFSFRVAHDYSEAMAIRVPVTLRAGKDETTFNAYIDTGSSFCVFRRGQAEVLGIDVESGSLLRIDTVTGGFDAYGHMLTLETLGYSFDVTVYFAAHESFSRNVLGRIGWLDQVRLGLIEYESKLYLSRYNE